MKITSQEEFGIRILIRLARNEDGLSIAEISEKEGLTHANVAKICRILRIASLIQSTKGHHGGYSLARPANKISLKEVIDVLGGPLYNEGFCHRFSGEQNICTHNVDCTVRSLWKVVQSGIDNVLIKLYLSDLIGTEKVAEEQICSSLKIDHR